MIIITTDRLPHPKVRGNARVNHHQKAQIVAAEKEYMAGVLRDACFVNGPALAKATATFSFWNNREIDWDNFLIGCKAWMDAIVDHGIIKDDRPSVLSIVLDSWHKCKRGEEKVVIQIEERA